MIARTQRLAVDSGNVLHDAKVDSAANTGVVLTIAAMSELVNFLTHVVWSYSGAPSGGKLTVTGGVTAWEIDITAGGPAGLSPHLKGSAVNTAMVVTLAAGGVGVVGKLMLEACRLTPRT